MARDVKPKRRYDSKRRLEQAQETRRAILGAAKTRFEELGYAATTVAEIAADAGVATKTVYLAFATHFPCSRFHLASPEFHCKEMKRIS